MLSNLNSSDLKFILQEYIKKDKKLKIQILKAIVFCMVGLGLVLYVIPGISLKSIQNHINIINDVNSSDIIISELILKNAQMAISNSNDKKRLPAKIFSKNYSITDWVGDVQQKALDEAMKLSTNIQSTKTSKEMSEVASSKILTLTLRGAPTIYADKLINFLKFLHEDNLKLIYNDIEVNSTMKQITNVVIKLQVYQEKQVLNEK